MDVDDDDEYMNAAAAHAAFVLTVSAARMYWLLRHAQQGRNHWGSGRSEPPKFGRTTPTILMKSVITVT